MLVNLAMPSDTHAYTVDRDKFFSNFRAKYGSPTQSQVDGINYILTNMESDTRPATADRTVWMRQLAYMFATTKLEVGNTYQPITEYDNYTCVRYDGGCTYKGRGYVQLTHRFNYAKFSPLVSVDLVTYPLRALEPDIAYTVMSHGMFYGMFTGVALGQYVKSGLTDYYNARRVVNSLDGADLIAGYARDFQYIFEQSTSLLPGGATKPKNDLVAIAHSNTGSGATEVHVLSGESNYQTYIQHQATALHQTGTDWQHLIADIDGDGKPDLVNIDHDGTGSGGVEMHTLSGASNYQTFIQHLTVPLGYSGANATYTMADIDGDKKPELVLFRQTSSNTTEVHTLSGASNYQTFIQHLTTPLGYSAANATNDMADIDGDKKPDLVQILHDQTGSGATEVHVLSGASNYQTFIQHVATGLSTTGADFAFEMADIDSDGKPDLVATDHNGAGSGMTEVHVLSGASNYQTFIRQQPTALGYTSSNSDTLVFGAMGD